MTEKEKEEAVRFVRQWAESYPGTTNYHVEKQDQAVVMTINFYCAYTDFYYLLKGLHMRAYRTKMFFLSHGDLEISIYK